MTNNNTNNGDGTMTTIAVSAKYGQKTLAGKITITPPKTSSPGVGVAFKAETPAGLDDLDRHKHQSDCRKCFAHLVSTLASASDHVNRSKETVPKTIADILTSYGCGEAVEAIESAATWELADGDEEQHARIAARKATRKERKPFTSGDMAASEKAISDDLAKHGF